MPRQAKRSRDARDATEVVQSTRLAKSPRYASPSHTDQASSSTALAPPNEAWRGSTGDELEPSTQDLTQRDDGPERELYGTFGMCRENLIQKNPIVLTGVQMEKLWV